MNDVVHNLNILGGLGEEGRERRRIEKIDNTIEQQYLIYVLTNDRHW
jgi:hypothetical protein